MNIGIVGLGLIGGSFAKATKARTVHQVLGYDINHDTMTLARLYTAIDGQLTDDVLGQCDVVLLALRPTAAVEWAKAHAGRIASKTVVVDLCGVKRAVAGELAAIAAERGFHYIGGHPMAGRENGGFVNATADLYLGASMILVPDKNTGMEMLEMLKGYFLEVGFDNLTFTTADEHDKIIAYTSQLAHVTSNAYVKSPTAQVHAGFSAGSFKDLTRVAKLDEDMWTELFLANADYLAGEVELLIDNLQPYLAALRSRDAESLRQLLREGREKKATAGGR